MYTDKERTYQRVEKVILVVFFLQNKISVWNAEMMVVVKQFEDFEIDDMRLLETHTSQTNR